MPTNPDRNCSHLSGEYFVAAELYRRDFSVAITLGNAKAIDLFAERDTRTVNIQVKAIREARNAGWPITKSKIKDRVIYVFVCLNPPNIPPDYYICTPDEARKKIKQYRTRGIIDLSGLKNDAYQNRWDKIEDALVPFDLP